MKFMMLMIPSVYRDNKALKDFTPDLPAIERMEKFNHELGAAFKLTDLNGLHPLTDGVRVSFANGGVTVTDGPDIETKEVLGGYWMIEAPSKESLLEWAKKCPASDGDIIEIRQVFEFDEPESR